VMRRTIQRLFDHRWLSVLFVAGLACVGFAIVGGGSVWEVEIPALGSTLERVMLAVFGLLLVAGAVALAHHSEEATPDVRADAEFWRKVFDAMPPAFVKEFPQDAHLADNAAFAEFQVHKHDPSETDELGRLICEEHQAGDRRAAKQGVQFELSDRAPTGGPQPILTFKRRIEHDGRTFIVGWYVSIGRPDELPGETMLLRKRRGGVLLGYPVAAPPGDDDPFTIDVGEAARRWLEASRAPTGA
jgi:hypothetical protein